MRYEVDEYGIGKAPKEAYPTDTLSVWDSVKSRTFHEIVAPHVIEKMNHPLSYWSISTKSRTLTREEYEEFKEEFKERYKKRYGNDTVEKIDEIEYDPHMTEAALRYIVGRKDDKEFNDYIISKGRGGIVESVGKFGIEAAISILDPVISCFYFMTIPTGLFLVLLLFLTKKYIMKFFRKTQ